MNYVVDFHRFNAHLVNVLIEFTADQDAPTLWLPTWVAGSYLIREFSKNITLVQYEHDGKLTDAIKLSKNTYQLTHIKATEKVVVQYEVYCHDLSVRTAFVDNTRLFGNFSSLLLIATGQEQSTANITLSVPHEFFQKNPNALLACGLKHKVQKTNTAILYQLEPVACFESYDYPFEVSTQNVFDFEVVDGNGKVIPHRFFIAGKHHGNLTRLKTDVQKICQTHVDKWGTTPFDDYTFMTMVTGNDYGGLEHINSTALVSPRTNLPTAFESKIPSDDYQSYLGLCSHEYFHAWWVKSVRPDVMMTSTLQVEAPTPLLWVFEGFTSYVDDFMLLHAGVIDKSTYLKLLSTQINRYYQTAGRDSQSVAESSFDAWIKLYRADENYTNQGVSYYNKGALVALLLDLTLLKHSDGKYRLFDVIRAFYQKALSCKDGRFGMTHDNLGEVIQTFIPAKVWQHFFNNYVIGRTPLPIEEVLSEFGVNIDAKDNLKVWGMTTEDTASGLKIKHLLRDGGASHAGLSVNDVIIAIDWLKADQKVLETTSKYQNHHQKSITVHAFRRDELMTFEVKNNSNNHRQISLSGGNDAWLEDQA